MFNRAARLSAAFIALFAGTTLAMNQPKLSAYFGFDPMRTIVVDNDCGPMLVSDLNQDGLSDIIIVNNSKSRIELYMGRKSPKTLEEMMKDLKVNQLRPTAHYDRKEITLSNRVGGLRAHDVDGDGKLDLIYAGSSPAEIVILKQQADGTFSTLQKHRLRGLQARQSALRIADVMGDAAPELIVMAEEKITVYPLKNDGTLGEPRRLGSSGQIAGLLVEDFDGDGLTDLLGLVPEDPMPVRLYRQQQDPQSKVKRGLLNAELRFESPGIRDADTARFEGRKGAGLGVIERVSRRVVFYDFSNAPIEATSESSAERETQAEAYGFTDGSSKERSLLTADIDGDGLIDLLATDSKTNTLNLYRQRTGVGLGDSEAFSAFKQPKFIVSAAPSMWDDSKTATVFVLSEEEKAVGVSRYDAATRKLTFPVPVTLKTTGATPAAIGFISLDSVGTLAVVVKNKRDHTLELHQPMNKTSEGKESDGVMAVTLTNVSRPPQSMLAADVDQDGKSDLMLFTPGEPMVMVRGADKSEKGRPTQVLTSEQMPQFGLVQAAGPNNTALFDFDNDGKAELLIADKNFVRACRYDAKAGWKVVNQITVSDQGTDLVGLAIVNGSDGKPMVVASDKGNGRLLYMDASGLKSKVRLMGFTPGAIFAGDFGGDKQPGVLCVGDDSFGLVRLAGNRIKMDSFAAYRSDAPDRAEHQLCLGDVNNDGHLDAVVCDARDQNCSILTFTAKRNLLLASEAKIFETRMFSGGDSREFEPRDVIIADATGDGKNDIVFLVHNRVLIYPQMTEESSKKPVKADR